LYLNFAKIENFIRKGMDTDAAFTKASAELGDVSSFADELSHKKRKEVFEEVYMDIRMYMPARRVAGYVVFGELIPFVLPGIGILVFLVLTERDRLKPWAKEFHNKAVEGEMAIWNDPVKAARFGMLSGAIWIFAAGIFIVLGFLIGFKFSWPVFIFATAFQLVVQGRMYK
jgi:hypothetical protein